MKKRAISFLLALCLLISVLPTWTLEVEASNSYYINGVYVRYDDFTSSKNECWVYANNIYNKIWGQQFNNQFNDNSNSLRNLSDSEITLTADHLKKYVSNAALGSVLRICNSEYLHGTDGWGHSQIIVQKDANGFTVFEGGLSASPYCREHYYTWSDYINTSWLGGSYDYIKYIKWPGAPTYSAAHTCNKGRFVYFTASHPHYDCYECSICGTIWQDYSSSNAYSSCDICRPGMPELNISSAGYTDTDEVTFYWDSTSNTTHYNVWLAKLNDAGEWESYEQVFYAESGFSRILPAGEYRAQLLSYNSNMWEPDDSDWVHTWGDDVFFAVFRESKPSDFVIEDGVLVDYKGPGGKVTIPDSVTSIGGGAFMVCESITSIIIPSSVKAIYSHAFEGCSSLTSVTIPDSVTSIGSYAFKDCSSLSNVEIPDDLVDIGTSAFWRTPFLERITDDEGFAVVNGILVEYTGVGEEITIPSTVNRICNRVFAFNEKLTSVVIPEGVVSIGIEAFYDCENLTNVKIPASVVSIESSAFDKTPFLDSIRDPEGFEIINDILLRYRGDSDNVAIPDGVVRINHRFIENDRNITSVIIPDSVAILDSEAFFFCKGLTSIVIPASVDSIGKYAFEYCTNLSNIKFVGDPPNLGESCFGFVTATIYYPANNATWTESVMQDYGGTITWVPYDNHKHSYKIVQVAPTCTEDGYTINTCSCGDTYQDNITKALGHKYSYKVTKNPTTSATGTLTGTCSKCSGTTTVTLPKLNATDYSYAVTKAATCTADGTGRYSWKTTTYGSFYFDVTISKTGHSYGTWTVSKAATCTSKGEERRDCSNCDAFETREASALGHNYKAVATAPTCTKQGYTTHTCSRCNDSYVDTYVDALGHKYAAVVIQPTCTENGYTAHTCSNCNDSYADNYVDKIGHSFTNYISDGNATCTADGTKTAKCDHCNTTDTMTDVGSATDHVFGEWTVTKVPTFWESGEETRTCGSCGTEETRAITKLANPFVDVITGSYYEAPVLWAVDNGITNGVDSTHFAPDNKCTREQVVTFLWRAVGSPEPTTTTHPFVDVVPGSYYEKAVLWAVENGITNGMDETHFNPGGECTRAQVAMFLWRTLDKPAVNSSANPFKDVSAGQWFYEPVLWAVDAGVTNGLKPDQFGPDETCTRAQIVTFLYRALG